MVMQDRAPISYHFHHESQSFIQKQTGETAQKYELVITLDRNLSLVHTHLYINRIWIYTSKSVGLLAPPPVCRSGPFPPSRRVHRVLIAWREKLSFSYVFVYAVQYKQYHKLTSLELYGWTVPGIESLHIQHLKFFITPIRVGDRRRVAWLLGHLACVLLLLLLAA